MVRRPAQNRIKQLLSIIPWILSNPGHPAAVIAARFNLTEDQLLEDLSVVHMIGLPPYTPDSLVDVDIDDETCVSIRLADYFSRPLRLTPSQALALLVSCEAINSMPGATSSDSLDLALGKLRNALGVEHTPLEIELGNVDEEILTQIQSSLEHKYDLDIEYYSYGRDSISKRKVSPWRLLAEKGNWYLQAWCHAAEAERMFRVDRIEKILMLDNSLSKKKPKSPAKIFDLNEISPSVTLRLDKAALWVLEAYPYEKLVKNDDETVDVSLKVSATAWLERLLMKLGDNAKVVETKNINAAKIVKCAVERVLEQYIN